jgi:hypothetical protein
MKETVANYFRLFGKFCAFMLMLKPIEMMGLITRDAEIGVLRFAVLASYIIFT